MEMRSFRRHLWLALVAAALILTWWLENRPDRINLPTQPPSPSGHNETARPKPKKSGGYETLQGARLVEHRDNDGDSFMIRHAGGTHTFRLYFADAPEKRLHQYNGERLQHQARYFGKPTVQQILQIGVRAREYAIEQLSSRPFTVYTRWAAVYDSGRHYAFVIFDDGQDLSEKLVAEGLARIYTDGATHPDGRSESAFEKHLKSVESKARSNKKGAWGIR